MRDDRLRLVDIQRAIVRIEKYTAGGREAFDSDELIQTWIVHHLQIIGEASRTLSQDFRQNHPEIPWQQIIGMRHILVYQYFGIDIEAVWTAAIVDIPALKEQIEALLDASGH